MLSSIHILLPDFAIIALGACIARLLSNDIWRGLDRLSFFVLYPALIFNAASSRAIDLGSVLTLGAAAAGVVTTGLVLGLCTRRFVTDSHANFGGALQNAFRFNTALGFVALEVLPPMSASAFAVIVGCAIPIVNVYAIASLTRGSGTSQYHTIREIAVNPFLLASLAGLAIAVSETTLPQTVSAFSNRLASAALPLVLLSLGAALASGARQNGWHSLLPKDAFSIAIHTIRLLIVPSLVLVTCLTLGLSGINAATVLIFAALPTATAAHVLAARYGANRARVATLVLQSSVLGLVTLPLWTTIALKIAGGD